MLTDFSIRWGNKRENNLHLQNKDSLFDRAGKIRTIFYRRNSDDLEKAIDWLFIGFKYSGSKPSLFRACGF
jgi:hypothetical protein